MDIGNDLIIKQGAWDKYDFNGDKKLKVCEDYGILEEKSVIISDGCSTQPFSDWGARILTRNFKEALNCFIGCGGIFDNFNVLISDVYADSIYDISKICLNKNILNASLSSLFISEDYVYSHVLNDGYLIIGFKSGITEVYKFTYRANYPYYLLYRFDKELNGLYKKQFFANTVMVEKFILDKDLCNIQIDQNEFPYDYHRFSKNKIDELKYILITTDGLNTFGSYSLLDVLKELLNFKSLRGEFIQRKVNAFYRELEKNKITNGDDLTIGGFSFVD